jgi:hypothetical protein
MQNIPLFKFTVKWHISPKYQPIGFKGVMGVSAVNEDDARESAKRTLYDSTFPKHHNDPEYVIIDSAIKGREIRN